MIRYALACEAGHEFESWFRSSDDYETQEQRGLLGCPVCGSPRVRRQVMAPRLARTDSEAAATEPEASAPVLMDPQTQALRQKIADLRAELMANSEDVGGNFAQEARKIHHGEAEQRIIHGQASTEEARALAQEGIDFMPLPVPPDERN